MGNYIGSSIIDRLKSKAIGNTGPTGPTGNTGNTGPSGPTGDTGPHLVGISFFGLSLWNNFSDGTSAPAKGIAKGKTGPIKYLIDAVNLGTGVSLVDSVDLSGEKPIIKVRPIKFQGHTVETVGSKVIVTPTIKSTALSVSGTANREQNIIKFSNNTGTLVGITKAFAVCFVQANEINKATSYPHTDTTQYSDYIKTFGDLDTGLRVKINPKPSLDKPLLKSVYFNFINGDNSGLVKSIFIHNTESSMGQYGSINLYIENAKGTAPNKSGKLDIFHSQTSIESDADESDFFPSGSGSSNTILYERTKTRNEEYFCVDIGGITCSPLIILTKVFSTLFASTKFINPNTVCTNFGYTTECTDTSFKGPGGTPKQKLENIFYSSAVNNSDELGACCEIDGTCELKSVYNCYGFFHGSGTTCGSTAQFICNQKGPCCINNGIGIVCHDDINCSDCLSFNNVPGIISKFGGTNLTCDNIDCSLDIFTGACCDGMGNCFQLSNSECLNNGGFYHGNFSKCISNGINTCSGLTGACCINGSCQQLLYSNCINSGGIFAGYNKSCNNIICNAQDICSATNTSGVLPGTEYGGGVVVGRFIPGTSKILGCSELFSRKNYGFTTSNSFKSIVYTSELEPEANAVDISCEQDDGGYLIILYPYDISSDNQYNLKNPFTQEYKYNTFHWGLNGYSSWGPILKFGVYDEIRYNGISYINDVISFNEGYWYKGITGSTLSDNLEFINSNFKQCADVIQYGSSGESRLFNKSHYGLHGNWFRSNGLYNTIRATYSLKAKSLGLTGYMPATPNIFSMINKLSPGITSSTQGITGNPKYLSDWFVPSHDEMAFIAYKTLNTSDFNINTSLLEKGYQPLNGNYWTSTGTFNYEGEQGKYNGNSIPNSGSLAFTVFISETGILEYYSTNKTNRQEKNKLRPIRIMRCDELYPSHNKIWKLPKL